MKQQYTQPELEEILSKTAQRSGWDFSVMKTIRQPVPWDYIEVAKKYIKKSDYVLDIGTGGGENFLKLAPFFRQGLGIDIDPQMIEVAKKNGAGFKNTDFKVMSCELEGLENSFDVILNRHAPYNLEKIYGHLNPGGYFITQQVGEKNMGNIKRVLGLNVTDSPVIKDEFSNVGLNIISFREYDVEYVVKDIESLVFWLNALDMLHSNLSGSEALKNVSILNDILSDNVDVRGFVTNEQRYLVVSQK